ncbi:putative alpha/Beta hydrolase [Helianthus anomalus]
MATTTTCSTLELPKPLHSTFTHNLNLSSSTSPISRNHPWVSSNSITSKPRRTISITSCSIESLKSISRVETRMWNWKGYSIRYQCAGNSGPALVLVHGFGANRSTINSYFH